MIKALCLGRAMYDINISVPQAVTEGSVTEFFDRKGNVGGTASVMALCLSKWGINVTLSTVLGNDVNGTRIRKELDKAHIDTRYIEPSYDNDTPISVVINNQTTKKNTIYNISDKYAPIKKCDIDYTPELICVDGYDTTAAKGILERFPKCPSVLDATMPTAPVFDLVRKVKYAICSKEFAEIVTGEKIDFQHPETLVSIYQKLKKKYINTEFVVTLGERGALYSINNQIKVTPSLKMEVKDTHGCGAIFRAAFAHTIVLGGDIEKATKIGCIAAGLATQEVGAVDSIPTLEDITNLYEQNYS